MILSFYIHRKNIGIDVVMSSSCLFVQTYETITRAQQVLKKRPGRITVNSEDTIMLIHAQRTSRY